MRSLKTLLNPIFSLILMHFSLSIKSQDLIVFNQSSVTTFQLRVTCKDSVKYYSLPSYQGIEIRHECDVMGVMVYLTDQDDSIYTLHINVPQIKHNSIPNKGWFIGTTSFSDHDCSNPKYQEVWLEIGVDKSLIVRIQKPTQCP